MKKVAFIVASLLVFFAVLAIPIDPALLAPEAKSVAAVTVLMILFWVSGVIPLEATALLPLVLFPALGVLSPVEVAVSYGNEVIFLFLGSFRTGASPSISSGLWGRARNAWCSGSWSPQRSSRCGSRTPPPR